MGEFEDRLRKAVTRGVERAEHRAREARKAALTEEESRQLHTQYRLHLSEAIEQKMRQLPDHFPGFQLQTLYGEAGWGVRCSRDDFAAVRGGGRQNQFSRLEMTVRPYSPLHVLELHGKATIRNRELFNRTHFEVLADADPEGYEQLIDAWILEFAELYAAQK